MCGDFPHLLGQSHMHRSGRSSHRLYFRPNATEVDIIEPNGNVKSCVGFQMQNARENQLPSEDCISISLATAIATYIFPVLLVTIQIV